MPNVAAVVKRAFQEYVDGDIRHSLRQQPGVDLTGAAVPNDWAVHAMYATADSDSSSCTPEMLH